MSRSSWSSPDATSRSPGWRRCWPGRRLRDVPCLIALFALIGPRVALIFTAIFSNMISRAIDPWWLAFLGWLVLPWTTLAYVVFYDIGSGREVTGFEWVIVGLAFVVDLGSYAGGRSARGD